MENQRGDTIYDIIFKNIKQPFIAIIPLIAIKYINLGDRSLDTAIVGLVTTFLTIIISYLIDLYSSRKKMLFKNECGYVNCSLLIRDQNKDLFSFKENTKSIISICFSTNNVRKRIAKKLIEHLYKLWSEGKYNGHIPFVNTMPEATLVAFYYCDYGNDFIYFSLSSTTGGSPREYSSPLPQKQLMINYNKYSSFCMFLNRIKIELELNNEEINELEDILFVSVNNKIKSFLDIHNDNDNDDKTEKKAYAIIHSSAINPINYPSFNHRVTFNSLFFNEKEKVINIITRFKNNKLYPSHIPYENKLGFLLHGPPGTGKTSFVLALANFLEYSIYNLDLMRIKTVSDLRNIFSENVRQKKNFIYFIDEIDCIQDVIAKRVDIDSISNIKSNVLDNKNKDKDKVTDTEQLIQTDKNGKTILNKNIRISKKNDEIKDDEYQRLMDLYINTVEPEQKKMILEEINQYKKQNMDKLNLGGLLQLLDGIESAEGRIIVACTNHPERIDPALIRPGRLGIQINLRECSKKMTIQILEYYFKLNERQVNELYKEQINEYEITPAQLIQNIQLFMDNNYDNYKTKIQTKQLVKLTNPNYIWD